MQDAGAQLAAQLLDARDGMRVLDACAAPGGKTGHVLELANVELIALESDAARARRIGENLQRLNVQAEIRVGDAGDPSAWSDGDPFDRILADVPCSASGIVRRHPDIRWLRRPSDIAALVEEQRRILAALWPLVASRRRVALRYVLDLPRRGRVAGAVVWRGARRCGTIGRAGAIIADSQPHRRGWFASITGPGHELADGQFRRGATYPLNI